MSQPETRRYNVTGMSCGHCVASVEEEVGELAGVSAISVDLDSGSLDVAGTGFTDAGVAAAVTAAGYEVVG